MNETAQTNALIDQLQRLQASLREQNRSEQSTLIEAAIAALTQARDRPGSERTGATGRRQGAVEVLLATGWQWDGKAWKAPSIDEAQHRGAAAESTGRQQTAARDRRDIRAAVEQLNTSMDLGADGLWVAVRREARDGAVKALRDLSSACAHMYWAYSQACIRAATSTAQSKGNHS